MKYLIASIVIAVSFTSCNEKEKEEVRQELKKEENWKDRKVEDYKKSNQESSDAFQNENRSIR